MIEEQIEKLKTLQESYDVLATSIETQLPAVADKIDNIKLPEIDTTELAKETTLNEVSSKLDNLNVEVDLSSVAKQGENQDATLSAIYNDAHNVAQHFGITTATEFTPMTTEEIESELIIIWNNTFGE